jgi:hypothetical protein
VTTVLTAAEIEKAIHAFITAEKTDLGIEVTLPVAYDDGDFVSVVIEQKATSLLVHDASSAAMRISSVGVFLSQNLVQRLNQLAQRYHCTFADGRVSAPATLESFAQVACFVANASRTVADYVYELSPPAS